MRETNKIFFFESYDVLFFLSAYVLCLNGHGIYTTWTTIASLINLVIALHYSGDVAMITCTRLSLSLLLIVIVAWFILENTVLDSRFRLVLTPYLGKLYHFTQPLANIPSRQYYMQLLPNTPA